MKFWPSRHSRQGRNIPRTETEESIRFCLLAINHLTTDCFFSSINMYSRESYEVLMNRKEEEEDQAWRTTAPSSCGVDDRLVSLRVAWAGFGGGLARGGGRRPQRLWPASSRCARAVNTSAGRRLDRARRTRLRPIVAGSMRRPPKQHRPSRRYHRPPGSPSNEAQETRIRHITEARCRQQPHGGSSLRRRLATLTCAAAPPSGDGVRPWAGGPSTA